MTVEAAPAPHAQVWALPVGGDPLRDRIGAFSNGEGEFLIEGLEPGFYILWGQPLYRLGAHSRLLPGDPFPAFDDVVSGSVVRVRAGRAPSDLEITIREGRAARPPPEAVLAAQEAGPPTPITRTWGSPCSGIRVRAERPFPANGPLWFARRWRSLRGIARSERGWRSNGRRMPKTSCSTGPVPTGPGGGTPTRSERNPAKKSYGGLSARLANLDVSTAGWDIEDAGAVVRHTIEIAWPETAEASLRFRSADDTCDGEPSIVCDLSGCELRQ